MPPRGAPVGWLFMRLLIWLAIIMKAFSTLEAFLAEVSRNSIPRVSANAYECIKIDIGKHNPVASRTLSTHTYIHTYIHTRTKTKRC